MNSTISTLYLKENNQLTLNVARWKRTKFLVFDFLLAFFSLCIDCIGRWIQLSLQKHLEGMAGTQEYIISRLQLLVSGERKKLPLARVSTFLRTADTYEIGHGA